VYGIWSSLKSKSFRGLFLTIILSIIILIVWWIIAF
jgi:hypothetical protein